MLLSTVLKTSSLEKWRILGFFGFESLLPSPLISLGSPGVFSVQESHLFFGPWFPVSTNAISSYICKNDQFPGDRLTEPVNQTPSIFSDSLCLP